MNSGKDLTKEPPRSPRQRIGGFAILGRTIDKGRALLWGNTGGYHFDCPLDNYLFGFKGVKGDDFKRQLESGSDDNAMVRWLNEHGTTRTSDEIQKWSDTMEQAHPYDDPERRDWFVEQCQPLGLNPARATLFDYLETDDKVTYAH